MGKYEPLTRYLESLDRDSWDANFAHIETVLGFPLPASARRYQAWWANQTNGSHSHARGWQDAGWETRQVNTSRGTVRFERTARPQAGDPTTTRDSFRTGLDLWEQARQFSGIEDRDELMKAALLALIQREAGKRLIELGGTMPDATAPPRRRFD